MTIIVNDDELIADDLVFVNRYCLRAICTSMFGLFSTTHNAMTMSVTMHYSSAAQKLIGIRLICNSFGFELSFICYYSFP
jgi:hypothetical protein